MFDNVALQLVQGEKVLCYHVAKGIVIRSKHMEKMLRAATNYEVASRCNSTSMTKRIDFEAALANLFELSKDAFWPGDSLLTIIKPSGTRGGCLAEFHECRANCAIGNIVLC
jgi:UDP:flavonoid glycosyltransferase YjiC (YdhE family)